MPSPLRISHDPSARRRGVALGLAAGLALGLGVVLGARDGASSNGKARPGAPAPRAAPRPQSAAARGGLSLLQLVGQVVILRFAGTSAPSYVLRALRERRAAGAILFRDNVGSAAQLRELTRSLQQAAGGRALICVDQEGGAVRTLPALPPLLGEPGQTSPQAARGDARRAGAALRGAGIDVTLAPVADVSAGPGAALASRAFPGDASGVARLIAAAVDGYRQTGVAATAKHFPGLGAARANTDQVAVTVSEPASRLEADLAPFRAAIAGGVPLVMASHALYPALDRARIASQSPPILTDLLRRRLGFRGVTVTDSLEARAVIARSGVGTAAVRSLDAGADLLLTTGRGSYLPVVRAVLAAARRSPATRARLQESAARVLALRRRLAFGPVGGG